MIIENLHKNWLTLANTYFSDKSEIEQLWQKIQKSYTEKSRHYHNLMHINSMLIKASENKKQIKKYDELLFAIWFHDIVYKSTSKKNEENSADFAVCALKNATNKRLEICTIHQFIISTKSHQIIANENCDNAFLLDFDLAILGADWNVYETYIKNIRKEYKIYPDFLYNPARKKVLLGFLDRKQLFFTTKYKGLLEVKAIENLTKEITLLS